MKKFSIASLTIMTTLLLAGCGVEEPSTAEIKAAMQKPLDTFAEEMARNAGGSTPASEFASTINSLEKVACQEANGAPGVVCTVKVDISSRVTGHSAETRDVKLIKSTSGWEVVG